MQKSTKNQDREFTQRHSFAPQQKIRPEAKTNESVLKQSVYYFESKHIQERLFPFFNDRNKDSLKMSLCGFELHREIGLGFKVSSLKVFPIQQESRCLRNSTYPEVRKHTKSHTGYWSRTLWRHRWQIKGKSWTSERIQWKSSVLIEVIEYENYVNHLPRQIDSIYAK